MNVIINSIIPYRFCSYVWCIRMYLLALGLSEIKLKSYPMRLDFSSAKNWKWPKCSIFLERCRKVRFKTNTKSMNLTARTENDLIEAFLYHFVKFYFWYSMSTHNNYSEILYIALNIIFVTKKQCSIVSSLLLVNHKISKLSSIYGKWYETGKIWNVAIIFGFCQRRFNSYE